MFNEPEEELYESLYTDSRRTFSTYVAANTVLNNYASIFSLLSRMRLAVNHPDLVVTKMNMKAAAQNATLVCGICQEEAEDAIMSKCKHVFCREDARQYILSAPDVSNLPEVDGGGEFISTQKRKHLNTKKKNNDDDDEPSVLCPVCYKMLSIDLTQEEVTVEDVFGKKAAGSSAFGKVGGSSSRATMSIVNQIDLSKWRSSTKIEGIKERERGGGGIMGN